MTDPKMPEKKRSTQAGIKATLRGCVCLYLCYLGWSLIKGAGSPDTTMPVWASWLFAALLFLIAAGFAAWTLLQYRGEKAEEKLKEEQEK